MNPSVQQGTRNDLADSIAVAESKWAQVVIAELKEEEILEASWKREGELVAHN
jgi:hypothetical protein